MQGCSGRVRHVGIVEATRSLGEDLRLYGCDACGVTISESESGPHSHLIPACSSRDLYTLAALRDAAQSGPWTKGPPDAKGREVWWGPDGAQVTLTWDHGYLLKVHGERMIARVLRRALC
jgi:hypothetical protein